MAKKKKTEQAATTSREDELKQQITEALDSGNEELASQLEEELKKEKSSGKKITKKFPKLSDYKAKYGNTANFKKQEWIDMSPAFKEVTCLPGIPVGHIIMNYGKSDTGKSTMAIEAAANAQKQGILPVFIITENKFSFERAEKMGIDFDEAIVYNDVPTIEDGCEYINQILKDQESGDLPVDVFIVWDSVGGTPSRREKKAAEAGDDKGGGMMVTAKVLREKITRFIAPKINGTRREEYPYNATLFVVNQAYTAPPAMPTAPPSLVPYGGDAVYYSATLVFRQGGVMGRSSKATATKGGIKVGFALKTALVVDKNHITNVTPSGKILCTDHGFLLDDKAAIDEYKAQHKDGWQIDFDQYWNSISDDYVPHNESGE